MTNKETWQYLSYTTSALVAEDGEIVDEITKISDDGFVVKSTGKKYMTSIQAKQAAEKTRRVQHVKRCFYCR